ncbi:BlaI/MecI/CopY family transcriptional regulator [Pseudoglutamicibacter cumminsii]|uniref:CopY family transcriptional regulator n=1 Tax=Pseudoglutamicibacter cumminsii TaxID=156979 RepID=A0ABX5L5N1_9MICC|nr:BlaI/MecI/CopY family transcriptional regulator [Pseudoglutamicibacter cumminsii]MDZ3744926.1 BlaI/MecI/CopY family transcriptional regulator [Pseudoglutamicibacter cumminsii]PWI27494.1 CopY family transcriptional regulator [Pseudoglutamicibacter cumminsii]
MTPIRERGQLEREVLDLLRENVSPMSARQLQDAFDEPAPAYTTIMTVLARLEKKGQVTRGGPSPRKTTFQAVHSDEDAASHGMLAALGQANDRKAALLAFAGNLDAADVALLNEAFNSKKRRKS